MTAGGGWTIHRFDLVDSTQRVAAGLIARGTPHRTVVVADRQTAGYGRKGDLWLDAPGDSLLLTLVLRPNNKPDTASMVHYSMIAALALLDAIEVCTGARGTIKWPNDLHLGGRKVGGILGDAQWSGGRLDALRIGIGVNVRGARERFVARGLPDATSVTAETGCDLDRDALLYALLHAFGTYDALLAAGDAARIVAAWRARIATIGQSVIATLVDGRTVTGTATGVTDDGDLLIVGNEGNATRVSAPAVRSLRRAVASGGADRTP